MKLTIVMKSVIFISLFWSCSPRTTTTASRNASVTAPTNSLLGNAKGVGTSSAINNGNTVNSNAGTTGSGASSQAVAGPGASLTSSTSANLSQPFLNSMSDSDLQTYYKNRLEQLQQDKMNFAINDQIANALCARYQELQSSCIVANYIMPTAGSNLQCGSSTGTNTTLNFNAPSPFTIALTDTNGKPLAASTMPGQFVLYVNGLYKSSPFAAGKTTNINFTFVGAGNAAVNPITIEQIYNLELRRADENPAAIVSAMTTKNADALKAANPLPPRSSFYVQVFYNGQKLTDGQPLDYTGDTNFIGYRYILNLQTIFSYAKSSNCTINPGEIDYIKTQISSSIKNSVSQTQSQSSKSQIFSGVYTAPPSRNDMINQIVAAQNQIATLTPMLEDSRNRIMVLTNAFNTGSVIGCHYSEPIVQLTIDIKGTSNLPKPLNDKYSKCPQFSPNGPGSILSFQMGSSVNISIDQAKFSIGGAPWVGPVPDQALVGDIQYLKISKLGITIDDLGPVCVTGFMGTGSSCAEMCQEINTYSITGIKISVDTPSISAFTIYNNPNVNQTFASDLYSSNAVINWVDSNLRSDPNWVKLMYDTNCDTTK